MAVGGYAYRARRGVDLTSDPAAMRHALFRSQRPKRQGIGETHRAAKRLGTLADHEHANDGDSGHCSAVSKFRCSVRSRTEMNIVFSSTFVFLFASCLTEHEPITRLEAAFVREGDNE